ncbi:MAG TPA: hypothetical protein VF761_16455 [Gemmatimonadaceae bacterium]
MADQSDNAQRPRPFVPPVRPFGGSAASARPSLTPFTPPERARPPAPFVARRPAKPIEEPLPATSAAPKEVPDSLSSPAAGLPLLIDESAAATQAAVAALPALAPTVGPRDDAHLYGHDPFAAVAAPAPRAEVPGEDAAPEEAATALAGLPYFDDTGSAHAPREDTSPSRTSGKVHRVGFDPAQVLESIAQRIRSGALQLPELDAHSTEEATLASILAVLLRDGRR